MLRTIIDTDIEQLKSLAEDAVRTSVTKVEKEVQFLTNDINKSMELWISTGSKGFGEKYLVKQEIVGFIIVKEYWNLSQLFVSPSFQRKGIGRAMITKAIVSCRKKSPRSKMQLNSSNSAAGFYKSMGFNQIGPALDRPGGCIPFEYSF